MSIVSNNNQTFYLIEVGGRYEVVNGPLASPDLQLFSLIPTELDENGIPEGKFFFIPKTIKSSDIEPRQATVKTIGSTDNISVGQVVEIIVDGVTLPLTLAAGINTEQVATVINTEAENLLGASYSNIATGVNPEQSITLTNVTGTFVKDDVILQASTGATGEVKDVIVDTGVSPDSVTLVVGDITGTFITYSGAGDEITVVGSSPLVTGNPTDIIISKSGSLTLKTPFTQNTHIIIPDGNVLVDDMKLIAGEFWGDLPISARSYIPDRDEVFILTRESVTPNQGEASGRFLDVKLENGILRFLPEFDRTLITTNSRLSLLVDSFAYVIQRYNDELQGFIDQVNISNLPEDRIEYLAYKYGIDIDEMLSLTDGALSARELLKEIINIIHIKGTNLSFETMLKFTGLIGDVKEFRRDGKLIKDDVDLTTAQEFYDRFLIKDSEYRNPLVNYGDVISDLNDLPENPLGNEVVKYNDATAPGIYQYNEDTEVWDTPYDDIFPISGLGNDPVAELADLDWTLEEVNRFYTKIPLNIYNDLQILSGFDFQVVNGASASPIAYQIEESSSVNLQAFVISSLDGPYDLTAFLDRQIILIIDGATQVNIDLTDFINSINDITAVTVNELKQILEQNAPVQVNELDDGRFVIASSKLGSLSSVRVIENNSALGLTAGTFIQASKTAVNFRLSAGQANPTDDEIQIPQVQTAITDFTITNGGSSPLDGVYKIHLDNQNDFIISSMNKFDNSFFDPSFGWIDKALDENTNVVIGTVIVEAGEFVKWNGEPKQDDYQVSIDLTDAQKAAIKSFIRDKLAVSGELEPSTFVSARQAGGSFYFRDTERNAGQICDPGVSNNIRIDSTQVKDDFLLTNEVTTLTTKLIEYVRPVHVSLYSIAFQSPEIIDQWPTIGDQGTGETWGYSGVVQPKIVDDTVSPPITSLGRLSHEPDIEVELTPMYHMEEGWFTTGDEIAWYDTDETIPTIPTSGEDVGTTAANNTNRLNKLSGDLYGDIIVDYDPATDSCLVGGSVASLSPYTLDPAAPKTNRNLIRLSVDDAYGWTEGDSITNTTVSPDEVATIVKIERGLIYTASSPNQTYDDIFIEYASATSPITFANLWASGDTVTNTTVSPDLSTTLVKDAVLAYNPIKRPMINDPLHLIGKQRVVEDATTEGWNISGGKLKPNAIPNYDYQMVHMKGSSELDRATGQLTTTASSPATLLPIPPRLVHFKGANNRALEGASHSDPSGLISGLGLSSLKNTIRHGAPMTKSVMNAYGGNMNTNNGVIVEDTDLASDPALNFRYVHYSNTIAGAPDDSVKTYQGNDMPLVEEAVYKNVSAPDGGMNGMVIGVVPDTSPKPAFNPVPIIVRKGQAVWDDGTLLDVGDNSPADDVITRILNASPNEARWLIIV